ncbi:hypothetical protein AOLI_G00222000 [Acnodon oligacanthus]
MVCGVWAHSQTAVPNQAQMCCLVMCPTVCSEAACYSYPQCESYLGYEAAHHKQRERRANDAESAPQSRRVETGEAHHSPASDLSYGHTADTLTAPVSCTTAPEQHIKPRGAWERDTRRPHSRQFPRITTSPRRGRDPISTDAEIQISGILPFPVPSCVLSKLSFHLFRGCSNYLDVK